MDHLHVWTDRFSHVFAAGQEFLVMHQVSELQCEDTEAALLCLLCERTLSDWESYAHVFSGEHVTMFLVSTFIFACFSCMNL